MTSRSGDVARSRLLWLALLAVAGGWTLAIVPPSLPFLLFGAFIGAVTGVLFRFVPPRTYPVLASCIFVLATQSAAQRAYPTAEMGSAAFWQPLLLGALVFVLGASVTAEAARPWRRANTDN